MLETNTRDTLPDGGFHGKLGYPLFFPQNISQVTTRWGNDGPVMHVCVFIPILRSPTFLCSQELHYGLVFEQLHINQTSQGRGPEHKQHAWGELWLLNLATTRENTSTGQALWVFWDNQESKNLPLSRQFDQPTPASLPITDWKWAVPERTKAHWAAEVDAVIISQANPQITPH